MCGRGRVNTLKCVLLPKRHGIVIGILESRERPEYSMPVSVNANKDDCTICVFRVESMYVTYQNRVWC